QHDNNLPLSHVLHEISRTNPTCWTVWEQRRQHWPGSGGRRGAATACTALAAALQGDRASVVVDFATPARWGGLALAFSASRSHESHGRPPLGRVEPRPPPASVHLHGHKHSGAQPAVVTERGPPPRERST